MTGHRIARVATELLSYAQRCTASLFSYAATSLRSYGVAGEAAYRGPPYRCPWCTPSTCIPGCSKQVLVSTRHGVARA
eukprot:1022120-Rhodomonas_salina.1